MGARFSRSRNFGLLRGGQFIADLGGNFSAVAIPAAIILSLHVTPMQVGVLDAVAFGTIPLCAAAAGIIADRAPRRPVLIGMNLVRFLALLAVPIAFATGHAGYPLFLAVAAVVAAATSVFDAAYAAFVPSVVGEANVAAGTAKLAMGNSVAEAVGTSLAGGLVMLVGAPLVVLGNAVAFVCSTVMLAAMRVEAQPRPRSDPRERRSLRGDLRDALTCIVAHPVLRRVTAANAVAHLGGGIAATVATIFVYRTLHLAPLALGIILGLANVGAISARYAGRIADRVGVGRAFALSTLAASVGAAALPIVAGVFPIGGVLVSRLLLTASGPVFAVNDTTLRLALVAPASRGRASATARAIVWTALPLGSLIGGWLAQHIGFGATTIVGAVVTAGAVLALPSRRAFATAGQRAAMERAPLWAPGFAG